MAITPTCDWKIDGIECGEELKAYGAILFSPPGGPENQDVKKYHICVDCYNRILETSIRCVKVLEK